MTIKDLFNVREEISTQGQTCFHSFQPHLVVLLINGEGLKLWVKTVENVKVEPDTQFHFTFHFCYTTY